MQYEKRKKHKGAILKKLIKNSKMMYFIKSHYMSYIWCICHQVSIKF